MTKSQLFHSDRFKAIELQIAELINGHPEFLSTQTASSTRAVGDALQAIVSENFQSILGDLCRKYSAQFARRAMADLAFYDTDDLYYVVDVKTHRLDTHFNMPNLTSVERLARFYEDDSNYFSILMIQYSIEQTKIRVQQIYFVPIEYLSWSCLTIGALGWGQIQIANAKTIDINEGCSRKQWMLEFCDVLLEFYPKEIGKVGSRIEHFKKVKLRWQEKADT